MDLYHNLSRLTPPDTKGKIPMVLDTDTYNEVDDQFALMYALLSPERLSVQAVYAAPFYNARSSGPADGMEKSYQEILYWIKKLNICPDDFVFRGSLSYLADEKTPVISEAAADLADRAMKFSSDKPLYVAAIGALTNIASAILINPDIIDRIVIVWLGGQPHYWENAREFNLSQDIKAARVVLDSGAAVVQIPCEGVASHLITTLAELKEYLAGKNDICDDLISIVKDYAQDHFAWSKVIWDISVIAYLIDPAWVRTQLVHTPILTYEHTWSLSNARHFMSVATRLYRNKIFADMFSKLARAKA